MMFISGFFRNTANSMAGVGVKLITLIYLVAIVGANIYDNEATLLAFCDDNSMHLMAHFAKPFHGVIFTSGDRFIPSCSFPTSRDSNDSSFELILPFSTCNFDVQELNDYRISISSTIVVNQHRMIESAYDTFENVTCELSLPLDTFRQWYLPNMTQTGGELHTGALIIPEVKSWLEIRIAFDLFPDLETRQSENWPDLFLVFNVKDDGKYKDMSVQNCIAHDERLLTNLTLLYRMSDVYGCPNASDILSNFTVSNETDGRANLMAFSPISNLTLFSRGELYMTCGVILCEHKCRNPCEAESRDSHYYTDVAFRQIVKRHPAAKIPTSLKKIEDRDRRVSKRSLGDIISQWFRYRKSVPDFEDIDEGSYNETLTDYEDSYNETFLDLEDGDSSNETLILRDQNKTAIDISGLLTGLMVNTSRNRPVKESAMLLGNERKGQIPTSVGDNKVAKSAVLQEAVICVIFLSLVVCYGLMLYSRKNEKNSGASSTGTIF